MFFSNRSTLEGSKDPVKRAEAAGKMAGTRKPEDITALLWATRDRDARVQRAVVQALRQSQDPSVQKAVASYALSEGAFPANEMLRAEVLVDALKDPDYETRCKVATYLGNWAASISSRTLVERIKRSLRTALGDNDLRVGFAAGDALIAFSKSQSLEILVGALKDPSVKCRRAAISALGRLKDRRAVGELCAALRDTGEYVGGYAAMALEEIGDNTAVEPLVHALERGTEHVRRCAMSALRTMEHPGGTPALLDALRSYCASIRCYAAEALHKTNEVEVVESLATALRDVDPAVSKAAAYSLAELGDGRAIQPLCEAIHASDASKRFVYSGPDPKDALRDRVREIPNSAAIPVLSALAVDQNFGARQVALKLLNELAGPLALPVLADLLQGDDERIAYLACEGVAAIEGSGAQEALIKAMGSRSEHVRQAAAKALGKRGDIRAVEPLLRAAERDARCAHILREMQWYPEGARRREIVSSNRHLGAVLGFPEAIQGTIEDMFQYPSDCDPTEHLGCRLKTFLPHSTLTREMADLIEMAASYHSKMKNFQFWDRVYSLTASDKAIAGLCSNVSPITSNVLHHLLKKGAGIPSGIPMSDDDGRSWHDRIDFYSQCATARAELHQRGDPPYDSTAYFKD